VKCISPDLTACFVVRTQAYCHNHGIAWLVDSPWFQRDKEDEEESGSPMTPGPSLRWLLERAGVQQLHKPLRECA
jgi:hypothetical protein